MAGVLLKLKFDMLFVRLFLYHEICLLLSEHNQQSRAYSKIKGLDTLEIVGAWWLNKCSINSFPICLKTCLCLLYLFQTPDKNESIIFLSTAHSITNQKDLSSGQSKHFAVGVHKTFVFSCHPNGFRNLPTFWGMIVQVYNNINLRSTERYD